MTNQNSGPAYTNMIDLASQRLGGLALLCSDDFFAPMSDLLKTEPAVFIADKYTDNGKWMDGWESRRKRGVNKDSHDWCVIKLGSAGVIHGVNIDTAFFTGNFPESASIEAAQLDDDTDLKTFKADKVKWTEILPRKILKGGSPNYFEIQSRERWSHLRFKIFPDGGVARLRVYGEVKPLWELIIPKLKGKTIDLGGAQNGAVVIDCNDAYFGHRDNLIMPGRSKVMGDGWETKRKRGIDDTTHDWIIVKMGHRGKIKMIEIDTNHFKGNFPDSCLIEATASYGDSKTNWTEILSQTKLKAHHQHYFEKELKNVSEPFTHVRLKIFPDGGISRMRINGEPV